MSCVSARSLLAVAVSRSIKHRSAKLRVRQRQRRVWNVASKAGLGTDKIEDGSWAVRSIGLVTHRSTDRIVRTIETLHHRAHLSLPQPPAPRLILELFETAKGEHMVVRRRGEDTCRGRRRR